eukprot:scaffold152534_cov16-Tisochrysis_lutea.AAC.1
MDFTLQQVPRVKLQSASTKWSYITDETTKTGPLQAFRTCRVQAPQMNSGFFVPPFIRIPE